MGNKGGRKDGKENKKLPQMFSYTTISRVVGLKKTKTRGGVSDHTGDWGKGKGSRREGSSGHL